MTAELQAVRVNEQMKAMSNAAALKGLHSVVRQFAEKSKQPEQLAQEAAEQHARAIEHQQFIADTAAVAYDKALKEQQQITQQAALEYAQLLEEQTLPLLSKPW